jgi:hypothetical protein
MRPIEKSTFSRSPYRSRNQPLMRFAMSLANVNFRLKSLDTRPIAWKGRIEMSIPWDLSRESTVSMYAAKALGSSRSCQRMTVMYYDGGHLSVQVARGRRRREASAP